MNSLPQAPQGFGQALPPGTPLPKGVKNKQVRFLGQPPLPSAMPVISSIPATGAEPPQAGGKRRRIRKNKTTKRRKTNKMRKTRRHR